MRKKSGFTLVEMLIVVIIIGILVAAIVPRLTGVMARSRDTKRIADLRTIWIAIQMYKDMHWEFPKREWVVGWVYGVPWEYVWPASWLKATLSRFISDWPTESNKNMSVKVLHESCAKNNRRNFRDCSAFWRPVADVFENWEYYYQAIRSYKTKTLFKWVVIAQMETPDLANFVADAGITTENTIWVWCSWPDSASWCDNKVVNTLCTEIEKWTTLKIATPEDTKCVYTSEDQLFYVYKIQ